MISMCVAVHTVDAPHNADSPDEHDAINASGAGGDPDQTQSKDVGETRNRDFERVKRRGLVS
jgi:hypothetical protein